MDDKKERESLHTALISVRHSVVRLHELLRLDTGIDLAAFSNVLDAKLITQTDPDYPLMVAITGGGSTGKSSLFNALVGKNLSLVEARAGSSRRALAAINPDVLSRDGFLSSLFDAFGADPEPLVAAEELTAPGTPKYVSCDTVSKNIVLLDTPDFDVGDLEDYTNRGIAKPVLKASDVLIYIFTGTVYNARSNTQFMADILKTVGYRKVILVYRCYSNLPDAEVREHAEVVIRNIYTEEGARWCLGIYRVNEDNGVAFGESLMTLRPIEGGRDISDVLATLDQAQTRADFIRTALRGVNRDAQLTLRAAIIARLEIELYRDAAQVATSWAATKALASFPLTDLLKRFLEIWEDSQPPALKVFRGIGKIVGVPVRWFKKDKPTIPSTVTPDDVFQQNLFEAANDLRNKLLGRDLVVETTRSDPDGARMVSAVERIQTIDRKSEHAVPTVEFIDQNRVNIRVPRPEPRNEPITSLPDSNWEQLLGTLREDAAETMGVSVQFDEQLRKIAHDFRAAMGWKDKLRETLTASLPVLSTVAAVTYVLATGDPVGGTGIYAHLAAMFGVKDLCALVAFPANSGLNDIHRRNLQGLLKPLFQVWFAEKKETVRDILERNIAGTVICSANRSLEETKKPLAELESAISTLPKENDHE